MRIPFENSPQLTRVLESIGSLTEFVTGSIRTVDLPVSAATDDTAMADAETVLVVMEPLNESVRSREAISAAYDGSVAAVVAWDPLRISLSRSERASRPLILLRNDVSPGDLEEHLRRVNRTGNGHEPHEEMTRANIVGIVDRIAEVLGGNIIVEDSDFQLLAHSRVDDSMDEARQAAILQRQLPGVYQRAFNAQGIIARMIDGEDVIHAQADPGIGLGERLIVAVRRHGKVLGTIWFARRGRPFDANDEVVLLSAAQQLARPLTDLLRARRDARVRQDDAVLALLSGKRLEKSIQVLTETLGAALPETAHALRVRVESSSPRRALAEHTRLVVEATMKSTRQIAFTATIGAELHAVLFGCERAGEVCEGGQASAFAETLLSELTKVGDVAQVAVGSHAMTSAELRRSDADAALVLTQLRLEHGDTSRIATIEQLWGGVAVNQCVEAINFDRVALPPHVREALSATRSSSHDLALTLGTVLDHWGDVRAAASRLHVHPNTVRYRLQRLQPELGIDLSSADQRLALRLYLHRLQRDRQAASDTSPLGHPR